MVETILLWSVNHCDIIDSHTMVFSQSFSCSLDGVTVMCGLRTVNLILHCSRLHPNLALRFLCKPEIHSVSKLAQYRKSQEKKYCAL